MTTTPLFRHEGTHILTDQLDVASRLQDMRRWRAEFAAEHDGLMAELQACDGNDRLQLQRGLQLSRYLDQLGMRLIRAPLEFDPRAITELGFAGLHQHLAVQYVRLSKESRLTWLLNLTHIMTPEQRDIYDKLQWATTNRSLGQRYNSLISGDSGMGKTTCLRWLLSQNMPVVGETHNYVPIVMVDAPVNNRSYKTLPQAIINALGKSYTKRDTEGELLAKMTLFLRQCGTRVLIIDEIEHLRTYEARRHLIEIANHNPHLHIIGASCDPTNFTDKDTEIGQRFIDLKRIDRYRGNRLGGLLVFLDLLLPFPESSDLASPSKAEFIEKATGGILQDIMMLVADAARLAIETNQPHITFELLVQSWENIRYQAREDRNIMNVLGGH